MRYLGIDYGSKRVGLARADEDLQIAVPYKTIESDSDEEKLKQLSSIVKDQGISEIAVGLPLSTDGGGTAKSKEVREFIDELKKEVDAEFHFIDERFTTQEAKSMGGEAGKDEKSAMLILDTYLG
ncbi:MAG: Holliday junction resolvase RuvX [Candidatus Magasanikbacteria bacterium]